MPLDVNALKQQAGRAVKSFSPQQLIMVGLLGVIALVAAMTFLRWVSAPSYGVLFSGLEASDASSVVEELESQGVAYRLEGNGTTILVPQDKVHATRLSLSSAGVPTGGTVGYELLDKQGFTTSEFRQRVDYQRAVEGELSRTLMAIEGVESASVRLAIPEESLFSDEKKPSRASILLRTNRQLGEEQVESIVNLVAGAVPDLDTENITVADDKGRVLSAPGGSRGLDNRQLDATRAFEMQRSAEAETMLSQVYGAGHAVVRVSAQLNFDETSSESERYNPASAVPLTEETSTETFTGTGTPPGGVVGVDGGEIEQGQTQNNYEKTEDARQFGVDRTVTRQQNAPGRVERLSVAVVLDGAAQPVPDRAKVEGLVAAAIGLDPERGDTIVVDTLAFDGSLSADADEAAAAASGESSRRDMMNMVQTGVGVLMLLLVAFMLWRAMRSTRQPIELPEDGPGSLAAALAAAQGPAGALGPSTPDGYGRRESDLPVQDRETAALTPALVGATPGNDVLSLIDQQPDEVATLLRSWLADRRS